MAERENDSFRRIQNNLARDIARDKRDQLRKTSRTEQVRKQLEAQARGFVTRYQREVHATRPEAETAINQVIQPWFSEMISSGTYSDLIHWSRSRTYGVKFSDPILFYCPEEALTELRVSKNKPYQDNAKAMMEVYDSKDIEGRIQGRNVTEVVWSADISLPTSKSNKSEYVEISRTPLDGRGHMWTSWKRYNIEVDPYKVASYINSISPEVWIEFGKQIENGDALHALEKSMQSRRVQTISSVERQADDIRRAKRYLDRREWH